MNEKFRPLFEITDRAKLFEDGSARLLAEMLFAEGADFHRLMEHYRAIRFRAVHEIEALAKRTLKEVQERSKEKKADEWQRDKSGKILTNQDNIDLALKKLGVSFRYNSFKGEALIDGLCGPVFDDPALKRLYYTIDRQFGFRPTEPYFSGYLMDLAYQNSFHPIVDYLDSLKWDGKARLDTWLVRYASVEDFELARACGAMVLIAAVRRVRSPGTKFDEMIVLEGKEGLEKSSLLDLLAVDKAWFTDSLPLNVDDKAMIESSSGKWIVEIGELQGLSKSDHNKIKAQLSRTTDRARLAYARLPIEISRQFIVFGTTNGAKYLTSLTGNRRFWPFLVKGRVDLAAFKKDRDQLWAEASAREVKGEAIRLPQHLWLAARREQEAREVDNAFHDTLLAYLGDKQGVLFIEDAWSFLGTSRNRTPTDYERLKAAMEKLGFVQRRRLMSGVRQQCFVRGDAAAQRVRIIPPWPCGDSERELDPSTE